MCVCVCVFVCVCVCVCVCAFNTSIEACFSGQCSERNKKMSYSKVLGQMIS